MKAKNHVYPVVSRSFISTGQFFIWVTFTVLCALLWGCATQQPIGVRQADGPILSGPVPFEPGAIGLTCPREPAGFSFDKTVGRIGYSSDAAATYARACLDPPPQRQAEGGAVAGAIGFVLAPFAAAYGALTGGRAELSTNKLAECESDLTRIMSVMADQKLLRDEVLHAASELTHRRVVPIDFMEGSPTNCEPPGTVLETKVEELRLERSGSKDTSFTLLIRARVRLHRASDGKLLNDLPFEYRSGSALFVDWTYPSAFRRVAETGYGELSKHIAKRLFSAAPEGPMLVGVGYKHPQPRGSARAMLANYKTPSQPNHAVRAKYAESGSGTLGVYSTAPLPQIGIQRPLTKDEAVSEALGEVNSSLDGLQNSGNSVVQLSAIAVAIPMSLWKQSVALIRGLSEKKFRSMDAQLTAASHRALPQIELTRQVALHLTPQASQPVLLVKNSLPAETGSRTAGPPEAAVAHLGQDATLALEIRVRSAALKGDGEINPSLALCVEAEATLFRVADGAELYSCPVSYRSAKRRFARWAANDAQLFHQELQRCYEEVSTVIVDQLVSQGLVAPGQAPQPTLANN